MRVTVQPGEIVLISMTRGARPSGVLVDASHVSEAVEAPIGPRGGLPLCSMCDERDISPHRRTVCDECWSRGTI